MRLQPQEIASILREQIAKYDTPTEIDEVGTVIQLSDGIARVYGLENCVALEMIEFPHGVTGLALNLEEDNVAVVLFGEWELLSEGDVARRTGNVMRVPSARSLDRPRRRLARRPRVDGGSGDRRDRVPAARVQGARRRRPPAGEVSPSRPASRRSTG